MDVEVREAPGVPCGRHGRRRRAAEERDRPAIAGLIGELGYNLDDHELVTRLQAASTDDDVVLVAIAGGRVVGMIAAAVIPMLAEASKAVRITALSVTVSMRNKGVGRALVTAVERHARCIGAEVVEVGSGRRPERLGRITSTALSVTWTRTNGPSSNGTRTAAAEWPVAGQVPCGRRAGADADLRPQGRRRGLDR